MIFHIICAFLVLTLAAMVIGAADHPECRLNPAGLSDVTARLNSNKAQ